jgi:hypothetical protein
LISLVVTLDENQRHKKNQHWVQILTRNRFGQFTQNDLDYMNRSSYNVPICANEPGKDDYCPLITTSNIIRAEVNAECIKTFASKNTKVIHRIPASISTARKHYMVF